MNNNGHSATLEKWKAIIAYDGSAYAGFQRQPEQPTIQSCMEEALSKMHRQHVPVVGSGRTDAGVHASGQVVHFESKLRLTEEEWQRALNGLLPSDIRVYAVKRVPLHFHARYDAKAKEYRYFIFQGPLHPPFMRQYTVHVPQRLDLMRMEQAAQLFLGEHDFTAFSSARSPVSDKRRTIHMLKLHTVESALGALPADHAASDDQGETTAVEQTGNAMVDMGRDHVLVIACRGNGFLYHMMRMIVGTLIEVGKGKIDINDVDEALKTGKKDKVGPTAPAHGLFLWEVFY